MKITEIPQDATLFLKINKEQQSTEIDVEIWKITEKFVMLKPIIIEGRVLNLKNSGVRLELIYERGDSKPLLWKSVPYGVVKQGENTCIVLSDDKDGIEYNRRNTFRLNMDVKGTLNRSESIIVHDISGTGISFYTSKENKKEIGASVKITFIGGYEEISVAAQIVREQLSNDRLMYGCTIQTNLQVERFLSEEQRRRASRMGSRF